jgi:hypothetical protein
MPSRFTSSCELTAATGTDAREKGAERTEATTNATMDNFAGSIVMRDAIRD